MKDLITLTDQAAVQLFIKGNNSGLEVLIKRYKSRIFTSIYLTVKDRYLAEDIFQETFIKIIDCLRAGKYNEENKFLQWAMRIAHNISVDHFRKLKTAPVIKMGEGHDVFEVLPYEELNREETIMKSQSHNAMMQIVATLPEEQQEVIILRHFANLKFKEIAELLECSVNTALGRMRYALLNIRKIAEEKQVAL